MKFTKHYLEIWLFRMQWYNDAGIFNPDNMINGVTFEVSFNHRYIGVYPTDSGYEFHQDIIRWTKAEETK